MRMICSALLAAASTGFAIGVEAANYASSVINYSPGTSAGNHTNAAAALGEPSRQTVDPLFGTFPVDPFGPAYLTNQIVTLGDGGSLTLRFDSPILNDPANPYGLDFIVFGNSFFQFNPDFTTTSGALGGTNSGATAISVSVDGLTFIPLNATLTPGVDALYPTDGNGDFAKPVNPALSETDFAGKDLAGIRQLYAGSGGGTGLDIGWAGVALPGISFIRFEQSRGSAQIDGVVAVPEPRTWLLWLAGSGALGLLRRRHSS